MKKPVLFVLALICVLAACKIDKDGLPKIQSNSLLFGKWYVKTIVLVDPVYGTETNPVNSAKDYYTFNTDNTFVYSTSLPDTLITSRFSYVDSGGIQKIVAKDTYDNNYSDLIINKLTADSLIFTSTIVINAGAGDSVIPTTYKLARK